jgi:hypothetical protein
MPTSFVQVIYSDPSLARLRWVSESGNNDCAAFRGLWLAEGPQRRGASQPHGEDVAAGRVTWLPNHPNDGGNDTCGLHMPRFATQRSVGPPG